MAARQRGGIGAAGPARSTSTYREAVLLLVTPAIPGQAGARETGSDTYPAGVDPTVMPTHERVGLGDRAD